MKISTNSRYAIRFLAQLAKAQGRMTTMSIAGLEGISEKMLERIAAKLGRDGIVKSVKGIGGGYELAVPAETITVTHILELMETPYLPHHCTDDYENCLRAGDCSLIKLWADIDSAIRGVTDSVTIADIARER